MPGAAIRRAPRGPDTEQRWDISRGRRLMGPLVSSELHDQRVQDGGRAPPDSVNLPLRDTPRRYEHGQPGHIDWNRMNRRRFSVLAVATCGILLFSATPAVADTTSDKVDRAIALAAPEVLEDVVPASRMTGQTDERTTRLPGATISLPADSGEPVQFKTDSHNIRIHLPKSQVRARGIATESKIIAYDNGDGSTSVPLPKSDGTLQITTVIESATAPTEYAYDIDLPLGFVLDLSEEGGGVGIVAADKSEFAGAFAAPWAKDANGDAVPTHFLVRGDSLIQVVDHTVPGVVYPVVADPWLNQHLYYSSNLSLSTWDGKPRVNATPTDAGKFYTGISTWWAHSDEIKNKLAGKYPSRSASQRWNDNVQEQLYCHIVGLPYSLPEYNLEMARTFQRWDTLIGYKCNYPESTWSN